MSNVKHSMAIALLVITTSCGLGPDRAACESQRRELERIQAELDAAAEQRQDLAPYVASIEEARQAVQAAGC